MIATTTQFQHQVAAEEESPAPERVPFTAIMTNSPKGEALPKPSQTFRLAVEQNLRQITVRPEVPDRLLYATTS